MTKLTDQQWTKIYQFLGTCDGIYVGNEAKTCRFIEAVLWIVRTGAQWREWPDRYGKWNRIAKRFSRWWKQGVWEAMLTHFASDPDLEWLLLDSTIVRAHPCAAGAPVQQIQTQRTRLSGAGGAALAPRSTSSSMPWAIPLTSC